MVNKTKKERTRRKAAAEEAAATKEKEATDLQKSIADMKAELKALRKENAELKGKGGAGGKGAGKGEEGKEKSTAKSAPSTTLDEKWIVKT
jgi:hypothetical protein